MLKYILGMIGIVSSLLMLQAFANEAYTYPVDPAVAVLEVAEFGHSLGNGLNNENNVYNISLCATNTSNSSVNLPSLNYISDQRVNADLFVIGQFDQLTQPVVEVLAPCIKPWITQHFNLVL